jgi:hypothetical protein
MDKITSFRDLLAWQSAMDLAEAVYKATENFPKREWFGLARQMRKSAVSVPSNISEGHRHKTPGYVHHVRISLGSLHYTRIPRSNLDATESGSQVPKSERR